MIWSLVIDSYNSTIKVLPHDPGADGERLLLISQRDPDVPLEFKIGSYYFNPLFKEGGSLHPYVVNGEENLVSIFTGKGPKKFSREKAAMYDRGWFELPPRQIEMGDIHPDVHSLIKSQPKLHGVIAQVARSTMNLRIPEGLDVKNYEGWLAWLSQQRQPLPLRLKTVFQLVQSRSQALIFNEKDIHRLLTGEEPEPIAAVKVRWYRYEVARVMRKQIRESLEWEINLPLATVKEGEAAIVAALDEKYGTAWRDLSSSTVSGVTDVMELGTTETIPEETIEGPLIWYRGEDTPTLPYHPLGPKTEEERPTSINDLFQIAIKAT